MSIRHLIVAALAASACAAHADVIQTPAASQSGFLSSWTTGNGTDVLNSGLFSGMNLIGGISHSQASKASGDQGSATLADVLYGKASASLGQVGEAQTKLYFQQGIEGSYLLGAGNGVLAAMLGTGAIVKRPRVIVDDAGNESIGVRSISYFPLTYDHRLIDGADAGRFLTTIKHRLEEGAFEADLGL